MSHGCRCNLAAKLWMAELISRRFRGLKSDTTSIWSSTVWNVASASVFAVVASIVTPFVVSGSVT